jgi:hypothetical protein
MDLLVENIAESRYLFFRQDVELSSLVDRDENILEYSEVFDPRGCIIIAVGKEYFSKSLDFGCIQRSGENVRGSGKIL